MSDSTLGFLAWYCPGGPWDLTAISVDQRQIDTATFTEAAGAASWLARFVDRNHYFHVNPTRGPLTKKAGRGDIKELAWLHVDIDFRVGESIEDGKARVLRLLEEPPGDIPRPSLVIFSGGGYQAFWRLESPLPIDGDLTAAEDAKLWNLQLEMAFGADACHNVDRIMRLPGTINRPNKRKREKGRKEALAEVVWAEDTRYPLSAFTKAVPLVQIEVENGGGFDAPTQTMVVPTNVRRLADVDELDEWNVPDWVRVLIVQGNRPDDEEPYPSRSEPLHAVCCELARREVPREVMYAIITDPDFGISESVLNKGSGVERYAVRQINRGYEEAEDPLLRQLNDRYAVIRNMGGKCRVVEEVETNGRPVLTAMTFQDFRNAWCAERFEIQTGVNRKGDPVMKMVSAGEWWLTNKRRRQYDRLVFDPENDVPGAYNLWRGFACDAIPGDCTLFLAHIRDNICAGDETHFGYLLRWMARTVQRPGAPGRTAVVLRGKQGTGKSFFVEQFGRLFGRHFFTVSNSEHLVGKFNAHLADCVVLFGDEAFYAGDKKHESVLKTLITEGRIMIERKGVDAELMRNCVHLLMASNDDWVVPAGVDDRRFFVLNVDDAHACDTAYFRKIAQQMDGGGAEALLHYLLNFDLGPFNVRAVPNTVALRGQKEQSLSPDEAWWLGILQDGQLHVTQDGWEGEVPALYLQNSFIATVKNNRGLRANQIRLAHLLKKLVPTFTKHRKVNQPIQTRDDSGQPVNVQSPYYYSFPSLVECRDLWDKIMFPRDWENYSAIDPPDGGGAY